MNDREFAIAEAAVCSQFKPGESGRQSFVVGTVDMTCWPPIAWRDGLVRQDVKAFDGMPVVVATEAAQSEPEEKPDFEKLESLGWQIAICAMCGTHASAIKPVQSVPVMERNQCDGCNRGLQVCDDGLHREPSGHPVMACTRNKYTHSIPAAELERLRKDADAPSSVEWPKHWVDQHVEPKTLHKPVLVPLEVLIRTEFELTHSERGGDYDTKILGILRDIIGQAEVEKVKRQ